MVARVPEDFQSLTNEELFDQNKPIISLILYSEKITYELGKFHGLYTRRNVSRIEFSTPKEKQRFPSVIIESGDDAKIIINSSDKVFQILFNLCRFMEMSARLSTMQEFKDFMNQFGITKFGEDKYFEIKFMRINIA